MGQGWVNRVYLISRLPAGEHERRKLFRFRKLAVPLTFKFRPGKYVNYTVTPLYGLCK